MKVQVIYSSLSGRTEILAKAIANGISEKYICTLHNLKDGAPELDADVVLLGYWVDKGGPNKEMKEFMEKVSGKAVGVFCTLGAYADGAHAVHSITAGVNIVKENNTVIGSYVCNGALSKEIIEMFRKNGKEGPHSASVENEIRWKIMENHPTKAECDLAAERFRERVEILELHKVHHREFKSVLPE
ncbi:MAG: hypothetical protein KHX56_11090 [Clostridiales bacterium]|nr:hypothetical protein [Clostridiales bacterium]